MTQHVSRLVFVAAVAAIVLFAGQTRMAAQQAQGAKAATPAAAAAVPTPRMADGHPDLNGYWYRRTPPTPAARRDGKSVILGTYGGAEAAAFNADVPPPPGIPKYKPEYLAKVKELELDQVHQDPAFTCGPPGVPRIGPPQRIVQTPREVVILYDDLNGNYYRLIPLDGRPHRTGIEASAHGDSVGHWDGDTLVIDVNNLNAETWLGDEGLFHTEDLHVTERLTRTGNTLKWEAIVEDSVLAEPWKVTPRTLRLRTTDDIEEAAFCQDRDQTQMQDLSHHTNVR